MSPPEVLRLSLAHLRALQLLAGQNATTNPMRTGVGIEAMRHRTLYHLTDGPIHALARVTGPGNTMVAHRYTFMLPWSVVRQMTDGMELGIRAYAQVVMYGPASGRVEPGKPRREHPLFNTASYPPPWVSSEFMQAPLPVPGVFAVVPSLYRRLTAAGRDIALMGEGGFLERNDGVPRIMLMGTGQRAYVHFTGLTTLCANIRVLHTDDLPPIAQLNAL